MSFGQSVQMLKLVLNVEYLLLLSFLTTAEFYNLGHIQDIIRVHFYFTTLQQLFTHHSFLHFPDPQDCVWSAWGPCNSTCGPGIRTRYAEISAQPGGLPCFGKSTQLCDQKPCPEISQNPPVDCKWSSWSNCNAECGPGDQTRFVDFKVVLS